MSAFLICDVTVKDKNALQEYLRLSQPTLEPFGGKFHVQAGKLAVIEGTWNPEVMIVVEFPSFEKARSWYSSEAYAEAMQVKSTAMERNMILVEGVYLSGS